MKSLANNATLMSLDAAQHAQTQCGKLQCSNRSMQGGEALPKTNIIYTQGPASSLQSHWDRKMDLN